MTWALPLWLAIPLCIFLSVLAFGAALTVITWFADTLDGLRRGRRSTDPPKVR